MCFLYSQKIGGLGVVQIFRFERRRGVGFSVTSK